MNLPSAPEAEQGVLSAIFRDKNAVSATLDAGVDESWFFDPKNHILYTEAMTHWGDGKLFDIHSFTQILRDKSLLEMAGGAAHLTETWLFAPSSMLDHYLDILREKKIARGTISVCTQSAYEAANNENPESVLAGAISELNAIIVKPKSRVSLKDAIMDKLERMENGEPDQDIIKTGINFLDHLSPIREGDMPLRMGKRKSGKSIVSLSIAENVSSSGVRVAYFSLEDRMPKIIDRLFAGVSRIPMGSHHVKRMNNGQLDSAQRAVEKLAKLPLHIYDDVFDLNQMVAIIRQMKAQHSDLKLACIDYAQLIRGGQSKNNGKREEVVHISRTLRLLAMETGVAILLLSQVNKDGEAFESKTLENDATALWLVEHDEDDPGSKDRKIRIPVQRNGESGIDFDIAFFGEIARAENLAKIPDRK